MDDCWWLDSLFSFFFAFFLHGPWSLQNVGTPCLNEESFVSDIYVIFCIVKQLIGVNEKKANYCAYINYIKIQDMHYRDICKLFVLLKSRKLIAIPPR